MFFSKKNRNVLVTIVYIETVHYKAWWDYESKYSDVDYEVNVTVVNESGERYQKTLKTLPGKVGDKFMTDLFYWKKV